MNTAKIKAYAPQAREDFINAVTQRANIYGIFSDDHIEPIEFKGDLSVIGDRAFTKKEGKLREKLVSRVKKDGFGQVMRAYAYTWFNRFVALRYMELHNYLDHGYRVLSNPGESDIPEILEHAADVDFPGLDKDKVIELRLAGNKDNELYRLLIVAQCNALHDAMPFLFERIDSETELLLPDNLLHFDSIIRKMVTEINEKGWNDVEIIGWIYQFYISERKNEVIGKVVKSEDIPAATQLFTPNWIVKYMVQNTLGRMWLATYSDSSLKDKMEYYIEPAEQEPEVHDQLNAITPKELNPEEITFLDPACGSGHILVEAYDVLKEIYLERGYRTRDIPRLILEKNLYGLDIDDRAAQLACFAVLMKARGDDRRILSRDDVTLNVMAIQESKDSDIRNIDLFFNDADGLVKQCLKGLVKLFEHAKIFGSLITISEDIAERIEDIELAVKEKIGRFSFGDAQNPAMLARQAIVLAKKFDCVVTNPPYMGNKYLNHELKKYLKINFKGFEKDLFSAFIVHNISFAKAEGQIGLMSPFVWMFISSYENLRKTLIDEATLTTLIQLEYSGFAGATVPICTFTFQNYHCDKYAGSFVRLSDFRGAENQAPKTLEAIRNPECGWCYTAKADDFKKIPGSPIAYWVSKQTISCFTENAYLSEYAFSDGKNITGNNNKYQRFFWEVSSLLECNNAKWVFISKGGGFKKWVETKDITIDWSDSARNHYRKNPIGRIISEYIWFRKGISWGLITSSLPSFRSLTEDFTFSDIGLFFNNDEHIAPVLAFLNSKVAYHFLNLLNPTLNYPMEVILKLPVSNIVSLDEASKLIIEIKLLISNNFLQNEISWDFTIFPIFQSDHRLPTTRSSYAKLRTHWRNMTLEMQRLEEENNRIFIEAYGLQDELTPDVPLSEITLTCNPHYRYGGNKNEEELEALLLDDTMKKLISYSIGCMMGRYSLDEPGLIYAHSGNENFWEIYNHKTNKHSDNPSLRLCGEFQPDDDGIIPIMGMDWFDDDAINRFIEFIKVAWTPETLDENLKFVADSLKPKNNEAPVDTIRRYLSAGFFKDHLKTYKKCPIYWLFSSGKQKAFECLVYLHRYNESTLSRMRSTYVTPLQGNFNARIEFLEHEKDAAATASVQRKIQKEIGGIKKKQTELSAFDDELRHYADMKISLDLDDGVKVNYGKFGNLLAETKAITGKK
ncbi:MAG: BREX-1 system adenine-specific DNA-methyltransferase PglX [Deltaproteobacteria bacterium]|jgi:type II restriction/modification system DNA methylase subunit YeeA|nr:BREX-1 system adenine-specific DNA-methyltransferase PglX [Deltaproteobacteria bacterium]MDL1987116.1 BREX-1 system adenine-specific DNA-methyltransferase PglX [Deltaproteobacteria bacterium]